MCYLRSQAPATYYFFMKELICYAPEIKDFSDNSKEGWVHDIHRACKNGGSVHSILSGAKTVQLV